MIPGTERLVAAGFAPLAADETTHNPLRLYLVMPHRGEDGVWFAVPVMWAPLPENCEALVELAGRLGEQRARRRFGDAA